MAAGIILLGNDPDFGTALGIATNATLTGNRFCEVTTPIDIEPLVSGTTNQGTLVCPFPPPSLTIAPGVVLTWPAVETGYLVECATNAAGPWNSLGIAPTVIGNEATVAVRTTAAAKFFPVAESLTSAGRRAHFVEQPGAGVSPPAFGRGFGNAEDRGGFFNLQAHEIAQLD
jgi:hypothetical protein